MEFEDVKSHFENNHRGVITTFQRDGAGHSSIVVCGAYQGNAAFVIVRSNSAKTRNLRRDPRCTVMSVSDNWRTCAVVEGMGTLMDYQNTDAEMMRVELREVFRACGDKDHPDWEEYDDAMVRQDAVIVLVSADRVYGKLS